MENTSRLIQIIGRQGIKRLRVLEMIEGREEALLMRFLVNETVPPAKARELVRAAFAENQPQPVREEKKPALAGNKVDVVIIDEAPAKAVEPVELVPSIAPEGVKTEPVVEVLTDEEPSELSPEAAEPTAEALWHSSPDDWRVMAISKKEELGGVSAACKELGISRQTWYSRLKP